MAPLRLCCGRVCEESGRRVDVVTEKIFESALGISSPWFIAGMNFEPSQRKLNIRVDFEVGTRFAVPGQAGEHPVHNTVTKTYRHLNFLDIWPVICAPIPGRSRGSR